MRRGFPHWNAGMTNHIHGLKLTSWKWFLMILTVIFFCLTALQDNSWPCDRVTYISAIDHIYTHFADNRCSCIDSIPSLVYMIVVAAVNTVSIWMMPLGIRCSQSMVCQQPMTKRTYYCVVWPMIRPYVSVNHVTRCPQAVNLVKPKAGEVVPSTTERVVRAVIHARLIVFICFKRIHANPYSKPDSVCSLINTGFSHSTVKVSVKKVLGGMVVHFHYFCLEELPTLLRAFSFSVFFSPSFLAQHSFVQENSNLAETPFFLLYISFIFSPSLLARQCHS